MKEIKLACDKSLRSDLDPNYNKYIAPWYLFTLYLWTSSQKSMSLSRKSPFRETKCWNCVQVTGLSKICRNRRISLEELIHELLACRGRNRLLKNSFKNDCVNIITREKTL